MRKLENCVNLKSQKDKFLSIIFVLNVSEYYRISQKTLTYYITLLSYISCTNT